MARDHARILTSIWSDPDFRELSPEAQRLYLLVLSQKSVNQAGLAPLQVRKWARAATVTTPADLEKPLAELDVGRYLLVDEDTQEVLVRTFIRNDGVWRQPNVLKNALKEATLIDSDRLRHALADELRRIAPVLPHGKGYEGVPEQLTGVIAQLSGEPSPNPPPNPPSERSPNPRTEASKDPSANPSRSRGAGDGVGEGAGVTSRGGQVGGSRARETSAAPTRPSASGGPPAPGSTYSTNDEPQPCGRRHDPDQPCRRCAEARRAAQDAAAEQAETDAAERAERARIAERCSCRRTGGWVEDATGTPVVRCDHERDQQAQLADALERAS